MPLRLGPAVFDRITGMPLLIGGVPVEKMGLVLWWPPTDNDLGSERGGADKRPLATQWEDTGLHRLHTLAGNHRRRRFSRRRGASVRTRIGPADKQFGVLVDYS